jgi:hypothetical protein
MTTMRGAPFRAAVVGVLAVVFAATLSVWDAQANVGHDDRGPRVETVPHAP